MKLTTFPKFMRCLLAVAVIGLSGAAQAEDNAENLLDNGDFAKGSARWWGEGFDASNASEGHLVLKSGFACQDKVVIEPGRSYKISLRVKSDGSPERAVYVQLSFRGEGLPIQWYGDDRVNLGDREEPALFVTGGTKDWEEFTTVYDAPVNATELLIYVRKIGGTEGSASFDDVSVVVE